MIVCMKKVSDDPDMPTQVDACVTQICDLGCASIHRTIERLEAGTEVPEVAEFDQAT